MATSTTATIRGMDMVAQCRGAGNGRSTAFRATRPATVAAVSATPDIAGQASTVAASPAAVMRAAAAAMEAVAAVVVTTKFTFVRYAIRL
jgi:hypothetical protein